MLMRVGPQIMEAARARTKLENLRYYLAEWRRWQEEWRPKLGAPGAVPYLDSMRPTPSSSGESPDERAEAWQVRVIEAAVKDLERAGGYGVDAIRWRWLGERVPGVWRANPNYLRDLADAAELALIPLCEKRNLLL